MADISQVKIPGVDTPYDIVDKTKEIINLTLAEYQALTPEEQTDSNKWYNITDAPIVGGATNLSELDDVNITNPQDKQTLIYDAITQKWVNVDAYVSNPNLLDNPWFTVNQRGFTTLTTDTTSKKYTVDRWFIEGATGTVITQNSDGTITIDNTNGSYNYLFRQNIEHYDTLFGKTLYLSILFSDGTIDGVLIEMPSSYTENRNWNKIVKRGNIALQLTQYNLYAYYSGWVLADGIVTIKAMKLEVGSLSTLALDTAPNYTTELLKCQRYFVRFLKQNNSATPIAYGATKDNSLRAALPLPTTLRTESPAISVSDLTKTRIYCNGTSYTPTNIAQYECIGHILNINVDATSLPNYHVGAFMFTTSGDYLDVSADL